jgi:hypothetical protein
MLLKTGLRIATDGCIVLHEKARVRCQCYSQNFGLPNVAFPQLHLHHFALKAAATCILSLLMVI